MNQPDEKPKGLLATFINISPVSYSMYDLVRDTLLFTTKDLVGLPRDELIRMSHDYYREIIHPDDYQQVKDDVIKMKNAALGDQVEFVVRVKHSDGKFVWIHAVYRIHEVDNTGKPAKMIGIVQDITRMKELEEKLDQAVARLSEISYRDAHLLRAPVATILGLVQVIESENLIYSADQTVFKHLKTSITKLDEIVSEIYRESNQ